MGTRLLTAMVGVAAVLVFVPAGTALEEPVVLRYIEVEGRLHDHQDHGALRREALQR